MNDHEWRNTSNNTVLEVPCARKHVFFIFELNASSLSSLQAAAMSVLLRLGLKPALAKPFYTRSESFYTLSRTITASDVAAYASLTGDSNPVHSHIVHGAFLLGLVGAAVGVGAPGAVMLEMREARFVAPCKVGQAVRVEVERTEVRKIEWCPFKVRDEEEKERIFVKGTVRIRFKKES